MEAPVHGVLVLGPAVGTEGKTGHGGVGPVVGQGVDQGVAGSALGAVGEGVAVPAVARGLHLGQAIRADEVVGRQVDVRLAAGAAFKDAEAGHAFRLGWDVADQLRPGQGWGLGDQIPGEGVETGLVAFGMDLHPAGDVLHPAVQAQTEGKPVDEGPEADPLDMAGQGDSAGV